MLNWSLSIDFVQNQKMYRINNHSAVVHLHAKWNRCHCITLIGHQFTAYSTKQMINQFRHLFLLQRNPWLHLLLTLGRNAESDVLSTEWVLLFGIKQILIKYIKLWNQSTPHLLSTSSIYKLGRLSRTTNSHFGTCMNKNKILCWVCQSRTK